MNERYYGKYRGSVVNSLDPEGLGRILANIPGVPGLESAPTTWATPCVPLAGQSRGVYVAPDIGAGVWIEFEQGDPRRPVWVGGFWGGQSEVPADARQSLPTLPSIILQTSSQTSIVISEVPGPTGGITLKRGSASITINDTGITLTNGQGATITLQGPNVDVNNGALKVM